MAPSTSKEKMKEVSSGNYISDDIAFFILSKLPVKSIKRFSCVRKSWSLLLENPNFFKMFRDNLIFKSHPLYDDACLILNQYLLSDDSWNLYFLSGHKFQNRLKFNLPPPFNFNNIQRTIIHILGGSSVNGILCICGIDHYGAKNTILWNPEIDQVKVIPSGIIELPPKVRSEIKLHGFGYDHVRNDYKVIQHVDIITFNINPWDVVNKEPFWEIYSLKSDSWRKIDFDMPARLLAADNDAYLNGICHWCAKADRGKINLVSFDLSNEVYFITPFPLEGMYDDFGYSVQVLNGSVAVILKDIKDMSFHVSILGELGVKESWVRLFNVDPFPIQHSIEPFLACIPHPIGAWKEGNIFFRTSNYELACLDLTTGVIEEIGVRVEIYCCQMVVYKKSLLPFGVADN